MSQYIFLMKITIRVLLTYGGHRSLIYITASIQLPEVILLQPLITRPNNT